MSQKSTSPFVMLTSALTSVAIVVSLWAVGLVSAGPWHLPSLQGGAPTVINYQGRLTDPATGQPKPDGNYDMVFRLYDAETGGAALWTGNHTTANGNPVNVSRGLFTVLLGSGNGNSLSAGLFRGTNRWIEAQVGTETLSPRQRLGSVPYALQAEEAETLLSIYGDGSAGPLNVTTSMTLTGNSNFTDCNIQAGVTLTVQAGTVIRCRGSFMNDGTIVVLMGSQTGRTRVNDGVFREFLQFITPGTGDASGPAGLPELGGGATTFLGGKGGDPLPIGFETWGWNRLRLGGGGGTSKVGLWDGPSGGGLLRIESKGSLANTGLVRANGASMPSGGGGGGGGMVILTSSTAVTNTGTIEAKGGDGGGSDTSSGPGGGGGGGLVMFVAPRVSNPGGANVSGGAAGTGGTANSITDARFGSGGGGGGSIGPGGDGGLVSATRTPGAALAGGSGRVTTLLADPATMWP